MTDMDDFTPDDRSFVYAIARRIVRSEHDAEDVTQDALMRAYRHRAAFRGEARYRTWLYRVAATAALGHLRRQRRARALVPWGEGGSQALEAATDASASPRAIVEEQQERAILERALGELAAPYRDVLLARADASESEVADRLGISVANVKVRAHRARRQLRAQLDRARV